MPGNPAYCALQMPFWQGRYTSTYPAGLVARDRITVNSAYPAQDVQTRRGVTESARSIGSCVNLSQSYFVMGVNSGGFSNNQVFCGGLRWQGSG